MKRNSSRIYKRLKRKGQKVSKEIMVELPRFRKTNGPQIGRSQIRLHRDTFQLNCQKSKREKEF